jgi:hypothetical protein
MNSKLEVKNEKMRVMALMNKWSRLIYGITKADRKQKRSFELCVKWASISRKLVSKNKPKRLQIQGRWNIMIKGLLGNNKTKSLKIQGRWNTLIRGILSRKKSSGSTLDRWKTLVAGLDLAYPAEF